MKHTRITAALLAALLMLGSFTACGESEVNTPAEETTDAAVTPSAEETEPEETGPVLPEANYDGYEVSILNNISNFAYTNIGEEGLTGETLDDTIYNRNKTVEEALNITFKIEKKEWNETSAIIPKVVAAGDNVYDFYTCDLNLLLGHVQSGCDLNVVNIESLELDQPWWNKTAIDSISIGDAIYAFLGDLHTGYFESHNTVAFNKDILTDLGLADPYEHVYEGTWTLDVMIDMMNTAKTDTNGDAKWTVEDQYGLSMFEGNWSIAFITGANQFLVQKDENNLPVWSGVSETFLNAYEKVAGGIFNEKSNNAINATGSLPGDLELYRLMFIHDRVLFLVTQIGVLKNMRDVEFELGVVPSPKNDESQNDYVSLIFQGANSFGIPVTNPDPERTGMVLNYLAAHSTETVRKTYMEQTLDFKYIQDKQSQEMLDIILSTGTFEIACVYDWGGISGTIMGQLNQGKTEIASLVARLDKAINKAMEKTITTFAEVGQ